MAGGLMVQPAGRVTLSPLGLSQLMAERRGDKEKPKPSKRAHAARLAAQRREDAVVAPQRPILDRVGFSAYLRTGLSTPLKTGSI